ncbi:tRNA pseudouridine(38-40) synthase TruA [Hoeflea olei]|uniref:tRNA pseudouridine synthase A n=1 Tax=Hoeflea olei TaxID=1480615 RepID=A0A1C1YUR6_9HYPH|nr:tRNA pseudouridine(38-40) synthase TruA [Hoeflea olei]OCW57278.1 pseudouridine synthase [Hoeflea olei]
MPRYRLDIEYDGTDYAGWQRQDGQPSIQQAIETAIHGFCGDTVTLRGAGRTDAGVHALGQVAHADLAGAWADDTVRDAVNAHLQMARERIAILAARRVSDDFDARFSALKRHYVYRILCRRAPLVIEKNRALWSPKPLDVEAMHDAAQRLVGRHDFTTFRSVQCQANSPVRSLDRLDVVRGAGEGLIEIHASAQSFLHNQIRSFAGTLRLVGEGKWSADDVSAALAARSRKACGPVAAPGGLFFRAVDYPEA